MKTWKLVEREAPHTEVAWGQKRRDFQGEDWLIDGGKPPHHPGSTGRVYCRSPDNKKYVSFFPSVLELKWVEVEL